MNNEFSDIWIKEKKNSKSDKLKEALKIKKPLKPRMEIAKNKIQTQNRKLDIMIERLKNREKKYFSQVVSSLQKHDSHQGKMISQELAQVRKTTKTMSQLKLSLEQVQMRLESTIDMGDTMTALGPAMGTLSQVKNKLNGILPEAGEELNEINNTFNDILTNADGLGNNNTFNFDTSSEDVNKILQEANFIAEQQTDMNMPQIPNEKNGKANSLNGQI
ncbi:MAG: Snf7 family protein [Nitrososphaeraceae archaeon]